MEAKDILDEFDDATLRALFQKYLKQNALEKSFKEHIEEHIAVGTNIKSEESEPSAVVPVNAQRKRRKSSVRGRRGSFLLEQAPPINTESRVPRLKKKKQIYLRSSFAYAKREAQEGSLMIQSTK